jgi:hypothetical protein
MSANIKKGGARLVMCDSIAGVDGKRDSHEALKMRLDDALRRLATLQQDLKEIRRAITATR